MNVDINQDRLLSRIEELAKIGATDAGAVTRLALTKEDQKARALLITWMEALGLNVTIDQIGNIYGERSGREDGPPVMTGSHLDTVIGGGRLDGAYGVLAGLEVLAALNDSGVETKYGIAVAAFTNEEGVRFHPDMMGSLVVAGGMPVDEVLKVKDRDGVSLKEALQAIGQAGPAKPADMVPRAFVELHIEQGPYLEANQFEIGVVENLTGISWTEVEISGTANHAGTTPMDLRKDAGFAAARLLVFLQQVASDLGPGQRATVGRLNLTPNAINVVPGRANITVDLRNPDNAALGEAENRFHAFLRDLEKEGFGIKTKQLVRFDPVDFDLATAAVIEAAAGKLGLKHTRMTSGAGHDAQMLARVCPAAMMFVPSIGGISHNGAEDTEPHHLAAGARCLLHTLLKLAGS